MELVRCVRELSKRKSFVKARDSDGGREGLRERSVALSSPIIVAYQTACAIMFGAADKNNHE